MSTELFKALLAFLQHFAAQFTTDIEAQLRASETLIARARSLYDAEGVGEDFNTQYLPRLARRNAVSFTLKIFFIRVLEDRGLLPMRRIRNRDAEGLFDELFPNLGARDYLEFAVREAAYLLPDLFDDQDCDLTLPTEAACQAFLNGWRTVDPDTGRLAYEFTPTGSRAFDTRFLGDVYENLDQETAKRFALRQTPEFISQFILEHTLLKCFEEQDFSTVTLIDPTCGSGHFLLDAFWHFVQRYEEDERFRGQDKLETYQRIVQEHLFGCDIVELSCELTRFRLLLAGLDLVGVEELRNRQGHDHPLRALQGVHFNVVCCDSLIPHEMRPLRASLFEGKGEFEDADEEIRQLLGDEQRRRDARRIFYRKHDVCVGNPPYVTCDDETKRQFYRSGTDSDGRRLIDGFDGYTAAHREFQLGAPFSERFFGVVRNGGWVGLINSDAFAKATFGRALIEKVLATKDMAIIADMSGVHIPGHTTPTVICVGRNRPSMRETVAVLSCLQGEPSTPPIPSDGAVWQAVLRAFEAIEQHDGYEDEWVELGPLPRVEYQRHPWVFAGPGGRLKQTLQARFPVTCADAVREMGSGGQTNADEIYRTSLSWIRRRRIPISLQRRLIVGEALRDWALLRREVVLFPYGDLMSPLDEAQVSVFGRHVAPWRSVLANRADFSGGTYLSVGRPWWEWHMLNVTKYESGFFLSWPEIATHNHFVALDTGAVFKQTAPIIKLDHDASFTDYLRLAGLLNSSSSCFQMKMVAFDRSGGEFYDEEGNVRGNRVSGGGAGFAFRGNMVGLTSVPPLGGASMGLLAALAATCTGLGKALSTTLPETIPLGADNAYSGWHRRCDGWSEPTEAIAGMPTSGVELRRSVELALSLSRDLLQRMIFLQEEMDWLCYVLYGIVDGSRVCPGLPFDEDSVPRIDKSERPFHLLKRARRANPDATVEEAMALLPPQWPDAAISSDERQRLRGLWSTRLQAIIDHPEIALLEDFPYKRRWLEPDYESDFRRALRDWLLDMAEYEIEHLTGKSCVTGVPAGEPYRPCEDVEPELRRLAMQQTIRPIHISELAHRLTRREQVCAAMEVYSGTAFYDPAQLLMDLMVEESVPASDDLLYTESGLRKLDAWGLPWKLTDEEAIRLPKPPEFEKKDFAKPADRHWKIRGKLNVPRERFIQYREMAAIGGRQAAAGEEGWFGWAGWDPRQRADALCWLLEKTVREKGVTQYEQCPLRIPLRKIVREGQLEQKDDPQPSISPLPPCDVSEGDMLELETIARGTGHCGRSMGAACPCPEYKAWLAEHPPIAAPRATGRRPKAKDGDENEPTPQKKARGMTWAGLTEEEKGEVRARVQVYVEAQGETSTEDVVTSLSDVDDRHVKAALKELVASGALDKTGKARGTKYTRSAQTRLVDDE